MKRSLITLKCGWLLAALLAFLPLAATAQVVPDWQRSTPGTTGVAMARDATDNVYVLGITSPTIYDAGVGTAVISRYSAAGELQWSRTWFPPLGPSWAGARPLSVFTDAAGNAIVIGGLAEWNYIFCAQITPTCTGVSGVFDAGRLVLKYSPDGTLLWTYTEVRFLGHWVSGVADAAGDIYVTGRGGDFSSMNTTKKLSGSTGATLWSTNSPAEYGTPGDTRLTPGGHVVVSSAGFNGMSLSAHAPDTGALVWSTRYAEAAGNYAPGLAIGLSGELIATGSAGTSLFVAALDARYLPLFTRTYLEGSQGRRAVVDGERNILVNGVASTPTNWVTLKLDPLGNLLQARVVDFHSSANEVPKDIAMGSDGSLFVAGSSGPGTATDPLATRAAAARYLPDGSLSWFASTPDATAAVAVEAATDGAVFVLGNTAQTLMHYPANQPPIAAASASTSSGLAPLTVNFSSAGSSDPGGSIASYLWRFGDGQTSTAANPSHTYAAGNHTAELTVIDNLGASSTAAPITITASAPPPPVPTSLTLAKSTVSGGNSTTATVTVSNKAGVTVALSSSNTDVARVPATVVVPAGSTRATFTVTTSRVRRDTSVALKATANGATATVSLTVRSR
jgi:PKD repeat protein